MGLELNINKKYRDFSLHVSIKTESKRIGILGASGCGKTLTLKSVAGLVRPDEGMISVDGRVLYNSEDGTDIRAKNRDVGYLFQNYALFPHMTVEENIRTALHGAGRRKNKTAVKTVDEILERFGISDIRSHRPSELSGGQQQKTALARILACDPGVLLLDEPFSAMDTYIREGLRLELLRMLENYDKTVVMVSHDRDEIYQMCDHIVLMDEGRVIGQGDMDDVFNHPETPRVARLTGCKNISRIERIDDHHLRALDWRGLELTVDSKITDDISYAGIRAHDFYPAVVSEHRRDDGCSSVSEMQHGDAPTSADDLPESMACVNCIPTGKTEISRLPFEWYVTLENGLWWKIPRELDSIRDENTVPPYVCVEPEKILLMKAEMSYED